MMPYHVEIFLAKNRNGALNRVGIQYSKVTLQKLSEDVAIAMDHSVYGVAQPSNYEFLESRECDGCLSVIYAVSESMYKSIKSGAVDLHMHNCEILCQSAATHYTEMWNEL